MLLECFLPSGSDHPVHAELRAVEVLVDRRSCFNSKAVTVLEEVVNSCKDVDALTGAKVRAGSRDRCAKGRVVSINVAPVGAGNTERSAQCISDAISAPNV